MSHTPGPWHPREPNGKGNGWSVGPAWLGSDAASSQTRHDAHLISAAPGMLEALEAISPMLPRSLMTATHGDPTEAIRKVEAAIKKARGRE